MRTIKQYKGFYMLINKEEIPLVVMDFMNEVHKEDVEIINALYEAIVTYEKEKSEANANAINEKYEEWYIHTRAHFKGEEQKMVEMDFPPYPMHKGEHDKAMQRMEEVLGHWNRSRDIQALKRYISEEVPTWLTHHIETMDTITAMFFNSGLSPCALS